MWTQPLVWGPESGHDRGAAGCADGLGDVGAIEDDALAGEAIHGGDVEACVAVGGHGVGALLVGPDEEEVGFVAGFALGSEEGGGGGGGREEGEGGASGEHRPHFISGWALGLLSPEVLDTAIPDRSGTGSVRTDLKSLTVHEIGTTTLSVRESSFLFTRASINPSHALRRSC